MCGGLQELPATAASRHLRAEGREMLNELRDLRELLRLVKRDIVSNPDRLAKSASQAS